MILIPISMVLQFVHVKMMLLSTKPDKTLLKTNPAEYQKLKSNYKRMIVVENIIAISVILMNIIITYTIVGQIKSFDCSLDEVPQTDQNETSQKTFSHIRNLVIPNSSTNLTFESDSRETIIYYFEFYK